MNHDEVWAIHAACRGMDPDAFFVDRGDVEGVDAAKSVCRGCPVRVDCLLAATDRCEEYGIWGGAGEPVRRALRTIKRPHYGFDPECGCRFCRLVDGHFAHLDGHSDGPFLSAGAAARHGRASTYSRGCRCGPCSLAKRMAMLLSDCRRQAKALAS